VVEAAEGGVTLVVVITEGVPAKDEAWLFAKLRRDHPEVRMIGPNCPGLISPGKANVGIPPATSHCRAARWAGQPLGNPDLPGPLRTEACRDRGYHLCGDRR